MSFGLLGFSFLFFPLYFSGQGLYSLGCPGIHSVEQAASHSWSAGIKGMVH